MGIDEAGRRVYSDHGLSLGQIGGGPLRTALERAAIGWRPSRLRFETQGGQWPMAEGSFRLFTLDEDYRPVELSRVEAAQVEVAGF